MSSELSFSYTLNKDSYLDGAKLAYEYELKNSKKRYFGFFIIGLVQFGVVMALKKGAIGLLVISSFLLVYWYFLRWHIRKSIIKKVYEKNFKTQNKYEVKIDKNGVLINGNNISWTDVTKIVRLDKGFLVYFHNDFVFFDNKIFTLDERAKFIEIAKKYANKYVREVT